MADIGEEQALGGIRLFGGLLRVDQGACPRLDLTRDAPVGASRKDDCEARDQKAHGRQHLAGEAGQSKHDRLQSTDSWTG
ncbi:MAG TPA: hypothetical protein VF051_03505 [Hyphomicrobiaceae bacterium]